MTTVTFTRQVGVDSSAIDCAYYNERTNDLVVDLHDSLYLYKGVPEYVVNTLERAPSAGSYYASTIKRAYGPGDFLGHAWDVEYEEDAGVPAPDMGPVTQGAVGTPKNLTYAPNAVVTNVSTNAANTGNGVGPHLSLKVDNSNLRQVRVEFEVNNKSASHTLFTSSLDDAVEQVERLGEMLDQTFTVKAVVLL